MGQAQSFLWHETGNHGTPFGAVDLKPKWLRAMAFDVEDHSRAASYIQYNTVNCQYHQPGAYTAVTGSYTAIKLKSCSLRLKAICKASSITTMSGTTEPIWKVADFKHNNRQYWVNVHGHRPGYQATLRSPRSWKHITGVVIWIQQISKGIITNLDVMWNKSMEHPEYIMSTETTR